MASETKRLAALLVAHRPAVFESAYDVPASSARLQAAIAEGKLGGDAEGDSVRITAPGRSHRCIFEGRWSDEGGAKLTGMFIPAPGNQRMLTATSLLLTALIAASCWVLFRDGVDIAARVLIPIATTLSILASPYAIVAMGSRREAEEAVVTKVIRARLESERK